MSQQSLTTLFKKHWQVAAIIALLLTVTVVTVWAVNQNNQVNQLRADVAATETGKTDAVAIMDEHGITPLSSEQASNSTTTADELTYLIEEEKLAHDVYTAMYDKWGVRIFDKISDSETTHQTMVLAVMASRDLPDPRSSEPGVFVNQDLQKLYDQLISQGIQSEADAYRVGIIIEETDIADLEKTIASLDPKDTDVKDVLDNLLRGSENHLRAFERQASRL